VIDAVAPTTTASPVGGTYTSAQTVTLTCTDANTGCANTYYTTNGTTPTTSSTVYTAPITISANTTLKFFSRVNAGNSETVKTQIYVIDSVAPVTSASPAGGTYTSAKSVTLTCSDSNSVCAATYYTTDGSNPTTASTVYTGPITIGINTTLKYFSKDNAGNSEAVQTQVYTILQTLIVSTGSVTKVTTTSSTLTGVANTNGGNGSTWFEYGTTTTYGNTTSLQAVSGSTDAKISQEIKRLSPATLYYYRFCAEVSGQTICGSDASFITRSLVLGDSGNISLVVPATANRIDGYDLIMLGRAFGSNPSIHSDINNCA